MLIKPTQDEAENQIDFAWALAQDPSRSGYPTFTDGVKTREDFEALCRSGFTSKIRRVLLYLENGMPAGWIQFFYEAENLYLQTEIFNISCDIRRALEEFLSYCAENFPGYTLYLGFPADNTDAVSCLQALGLPCVERSYNDVFHFEDYEPRLELPGVVRVTKENYADFRKLHESVQGDMYWNCERLYDALDRWMIWMYDKKNVPAAAIYCMDGADICEIFGVDFAGNVFSGEAFFALITKAMNVCKEKGMKHMVFFNDAESQQATLDAGFHCVGEYVLFLGKG